MKYHCPGSSQTPFVRRYVGGARKLNTFGGEKGALNGWRVITLEDWALIRRLAAEGVPKARIAQRSGSRGPGDQGGELRFAAAV